MAASRKRAARTERRQAERASAKLVWQRERLAALEPGGAPERAFDVASASVVEVQARSVPCPQCGGALRLEEHVAIEHEGTRLRVARMICPTCGARRPLYFRIAQPS